MIIANISLKLEKYYTPKDTKNSKQEKFKKFSVGLLLDSYLIDHKIQDILE